MFYGWFLDHSVDWMTRNAWEKGFEHFGGDWVLWGDVLVSRGLIRLRADEARGKEDHWVCLDLQWLYFWSWLNLLIRKNFDKVYNSCFNNKIKGKVSAISLVILRNNLCGLPNIKTFKSKWAVLSYFKKLFDFFLQPFLVHCTSVSVFIPFEAHLVS